MRRSRLQRVRQPRTTAVAREARWRPFASARDTGQAMSQQNTEVVRAALTAINDRDRRLAASLFTPGAVWHNTSVFPGPRVCVGLDAIVHFWETLLEDFEVAGTEIEQISDVDGRVVAGFHQWGTGRLSGAPFDQRFAAIFEVVDQRIVRVDIHGEYAKALEAVGLREEAMSRENVEIVRHSIEAWNGRDLTTWMASLHLDAEIDWSRSRAPFKGVYRGRDGIETFWDVFWSTFEDVQIETHGFTEAGSEVVVPNTAHMRGREGIEVIARNALVYWVENGQITRLRMFQEQAEALEAVGLRD
jgi:ketosteroid isomerase-like protein